MRLRPIAILLAANLLASAANAQLAPSISTAPLERHAYGANVGWVNFRWDAGSPGKGATVTDAFLAGQIYSANTGWIDLGDGSPSNGIAYQNRTVAGQSDFGVNLDSLGQLSGLGYSANVGWLNFGWDSSGNNPSRPQLNLGTGRFTGYAYGANIGWVKLGTSGGSIAVTTECISIVDTDGDMISDAWERVRGATDLTELGSGSDQDGDGQSDLDEFTADTDPFDPEAHLHIANHTLASPTKLHIVWTSRPSRRYLIETSEDLSLWVDDGNIYLADPGDDVTSATLAVDLPTILRQQIRVTAVRPLSGK